MVSARDMWDKILHQARVSEFEIPTVPQYKREPKWFRVGVQDNTIVIKRALANLPSVQLTNNRKLTLKDFELVYGYYDSWSNGANGVRREVADKSRNTAYIFGIIHSILNKSS
jgi:hypothetical protein